MKKIALFAAVAPMALALAACGDANTDETAATGDDAAMMDDAAPADTMTDPAMPADPAAAMPGENNDQTVERLDETAEDLEERADRVERPWRPCHAIVRPLADGDKHRIAPARPGKPHICACQCRNGIVVPCSGQRDHARAARGRSAPES